MPRRLGPKGNTTTSTGNRMENRPGYQTVTFTLRKGVKFHDNTDWNAEACKWNLEQYYITEKNKDLNVKSVDIIDDYTVKVTLNAWDVDLLYKISQSGPYWDRWYHRQRLKPTAKTGLI